MSPPRPLALAALLAALSACSAPTTLTSMTSSLLGGHPRGGAGATAPAARAVPSLFAAADDDADGGGEREEDADEDEDDEAAAKKKRSRDDQAPPKVPPRARKSVARPGSAVAFEGIEDALCSACIAVVDELSAKIAGEKPASDVDMRGRLSSKGDKLGKVTKYDVSELRAIELMEKICPPMNDYGLIEKENVGNYFQKVQNFDGPITITGSMSFGGPQSRAQGLALRTYCDKVLEENEDEFQAAIQKGDLEGLEEHVCVDMINACEPDEIAALDEVRYAKLEAKQTYDKKNPKPPSEKKKKKKKKKEPKSDL